MKEIDILRARALVYRPMALTALNEVLAILGGVRAASAGGFVLNEEDLDLSERVGLGLTHKGYVRARGHANLEAGVLHTALDPRDWVSVRYDSYARGLSIETIEILSVADGSKGLVLTQCEQWCGTDLRAHHRLRGLQWFPANIQGLGALRLMWADLQRRWEGYRNSNSLSQRNKILRAVAAYVNKGWVEPEVPVEDIAA